MKKPSTRDIERKKFNDWFKRKGLAKDTTWKRGKKK
jgi:hypothetical protein